MWIIWTKHNRRSFKDTEKSLAQLIDWCQWTLLDWSQCWGLLDYSSLNDFLLSLSIAFESFVSLFFFFVLFFVHYREHPIFFLLFLF